MANYVGNDAQNTYTLAASGITDVAWSNDEKIIYAATTDGKIKVFDVATHALLNTWSVGKSLGALSLSDDGKTLVAGGVTATDATVVFALNTATGTKTVFTPDVAGVGDVEIVDNKRVLVGGNGSGQILTLDLAKGTFTLLVGGVFNGPYSYFTEDKHITLIGEAWPSNGPLFLYDDRTGTVVASGDSAQPGLRDVYTFGIQAVSESAGLIIQNGLYYGANVYDFDLKAIKYVDLSDTFPQGFSFAPDGRSVYAYFVSGKIKQFSTANWKLLSSFTAPGAGWGPDSYGNVLHVSTNAHFMSVLANSDSFVANYSLSLIDLTSRNEVFKGTASADTFAGGLGDDTYTVNNAGDKITERANGGTDKVITAMPHTLSSYVETLQLVGSAAINGTGNTLDNTLIGNAGVNTLDSGKGNDRLVGVGGRDTLIGGFGNDILESGRGIDTLIGGAGNDTYVINDSGDVIQENAAGGIDTVQIAASFVLAGNLENLVLGGKAASGTGNALNNQITGNLVANTLDGGEGNDALRGMAGKDVLLGGAGNDTLDGGTGADTMTGGTGNDTYLVDHARDTIIEVVSGGGSDTVVASLNWRLADGLENLMFTPGIAPLNGTGNSQANMLTGNDGDNRLDGGLGADRMTGGLGNDTYIVDNKGDRTFEAFTGGVDAVLSSVSWKLALGIENLTLTGSAATNGTGNLLANVITGNAGDNVLDGGGVDDGFQRDTLIGGAGNDTYLVEQSYFYRFDIIESAGEGTDRVVSSASYDALPENIENLVLTGIETLSGGGNALANQVTGNDNDNLLYGYDGADTLIGSAGNDTLDGGAGDDLLRGGSGNDKFYVDSSADQVIEKAAEGENDIVRTSITLTIPDEIEAMSLQGSADINAFGSARGDRLFGNSGVNTLDGKGGDDVLFDFGFNDTLTGGGGRDIFAIGGFGMAGVDASTIRITDFSSADADVISLIYIDANPATPDFDPLTFAGSAAFSGLGGELRFEQTGGNTVIKADFDGDKAADLTITLTGLINLTSSDFQLSL